MELASTPCIVPVFTGATLRTAWPICLFLHQELCGQAVIITQLACTLKIQTCSGIIWATGLSFDFPIQYAYLVICFEQLTFF